MNIYVGGSLRGVPRYPNRCRRFVKQLGEQIIERGHTLLTGCRGSLDEAVARAAFEKIMAGDGQESNHQRRRRQLISYVLEEDKDAEKEFGYELTQSMRKDWELTHPFLIPPEQIDNADVTIFVAGSKGTFLAANWARIAQKPILGVAQFGGAGQDIFERERDKFIERYEHLVSAREFDMLRTVTKNVEILVNDVIDLCDYIITPKKVFAIMSFDGEYEEVYKSYVEVCDDFKFKATRTDKTRSGSRIVPEILDGIRGSAFVMADVSEGSENVFYEIGFAEGLGRPVIVTAKKGTELPFDIADVPVEFWSDQEDLKEKIRERIEQVEKKIRKR